MPGPDRDGEGLKAGRSPLIWTPSWRGPTAWEEYRADIQRRLKQEHGMIAFHESTMTKLDKEIRQLEARERVLEARLKATA